MYGKIFDQIYDGTLAEDWRALITFQQFIVLCDADGVIDMTPQAITRRTGIPIEHIKAGIEILEKTDKYSRTIDDDGCRIKLLDEHRPWGWYIVNHSKYKNLQDADTVRAQNRERKRRQRERDKAKNVTSGHVQSHPVTSSSIQSRHTDTDINTNTNNKNNTASGDAETEEIYLTKKKKKLSGKQLEKFNEFWDAFNYKSGKAEAADAWLALNVTPNIYKQILASAFREAKNRQSLIDNGSTPKMAEGWLSGRRFEDEGISPASTEYKNPQNFIIPKELRSRGAAVNIEPNNNEKCNDFKMRVLDAESVARATQELVRH